VNNSTPVLTDEQLKAIGSIAVESAYLENLVEFIIAFMTSLSEHQLNILLSRAMLASKLDILRDLGELKLKSKIKKEKLKGIIAQLKHFNGQRTIAIHGQWQSKEKITLADIGKYIPPGNAEATHKRGKKEPETLHASKLQHIANGIRDYREKLFEFCFSTWINPSIRRSVSRARGK
jgi:hypothetical protein